jgi:hypothetical protein
MLRCQKDTDLIIGVENYIKKLIDGIDVALSFPGADYHSRVKVQQGVLAAFGECADMPHFHFYLAEDSLPQIQDWMRLYAAAIRCSVQNCEGGFVFMSWSNVKTDYHYGGLLPRVNRWDHQTVVFFDLRPDHKRQVFLDPSHRTCDTVAGNQLLYFRDQHVWDPSAARSVVDLNVNETESMYCPENLQSYFCDFDDDCSTTVALLVVVCCLRFGSRDPQRITDALRCVLNQRRMTTTAEDFQRFVLRLRELENRLATMSVDGAFGLLQLVATDGDTCQHIVEEKPGRDAVFCQRPCTAGTIWCADHTPAQARRPLARPPHRRVNMLFLPAYVPYDRVDVVGYFEQRWGIDKWQCSLDVFQSQLDEYTRTRDHTDRSLCVFRFLSRRRCHDQRLSPPETGASLMETQRFILDALKYITRKRWDDLQHMHSVLFEILSWDEMLMPYDTELRAWFTDHVLSQSRIVPMAHWKFLAVVVDKKPCYVAFDLSQFRRDKDFVSTLTHLNGYVKASPFVPILALRLTTADHVEWLGAFWGGLVTRAIYGSPDTAFLRNMRRHIDLWGPWVADAGEPPQKWERLFQNIASSHRVPQNDHPVLGMWHVWCGEELQTPMNTVITTQCQQPAGVQRYKPTHRSQSVYVEGFPQRYFRNWKQWTTERGADVRSKRRLWQSLKDWWNGPNSPTMDFANFNDLSDPPPLKRRRRSA